MTALKMTVFDDVVENSSSTELTTVKPGAMVYGAGTTRATKAQIEVRRATLLELAREAQPASVRHIYYRAVVAGLVEKKQTGYRKVQRQLLDLRRTGELPFDWIVDQGRRAHWPDVERSPADALRYLAERYRRDPWGGSGPRVELWCESESLAGTLMPLRDEFSVPIFPIKGQSSESFVWSAARSYTPTRPVFVLYAGDYDPAGLQIGSQLEGKLRNYAHDTVDLSFTRVAIDDDQALRLQALGTEPKAHHWIDFDGARHDFVGQAIETEAVDARVMRQMFATTIRGIAEDHFGGDVFAETTALEQSDRQRLAELAEGWSR